MVVELWHDGEMVGTITGAYGPGIRVVTDRRMTSTRLPADGTGIGVLEVGIEPEQKQTTDNRHADN
jgi:hypothetical protein